MTTPLWLLHPSLGTLTIGLLTLGALLILAAVLYGKDHNQ